MGYLPMQGNPAGTLVRKHCVEEIFSPSGGKPLSFDCKHYLAQWIFYYNDNLRKV